jgi:hypothetical protein
MFRSRVVNGAQQSTKLRLVLVPAEEYAVRGATSSTSSGVAKPFSATTHAKIAVN